MLADWLEIYWLRNSVLMKGTGMAEPTRKISRANTVNISLLRSSGTFQALRMV